MSFASARAVNVNVYFVRSFTKFISLDCSKFTNLDPNVLCNRTISNGVGTLKNKYNKYNHTQEYSLHVKNHVKFYSKKSSDIIMNFYEFEEVETKNKTTFLQMINLYEEKFKTRKGFVDFIYAALKSMKDFGIHQDLEVYKKLIDLVPEGKFVPQNLFQSEGFYFPREQYCILDLLCQMEENGVIPDVEMNDMLIKRFGPRSMPAKKFYRMMYWLPKFKHLNPWPVPKALPKETFTLAKLAIEKITSVDPRTEIVVYRTEDVENSIDDTWVISAQSPDQKNLLKKHDKLKPVIVEGGDHLWLRSERINYFILKSEDVPYVEKKKKDLGDVENLTIRHFNLDYEEEEKSVHEQEDGIIYAICATGTSSKDSLLSWIRLLEKNGNPALENLAVLFRFRTPTQIPVPFSQELTSTKKE